MPSLYGGLLGSVPVLRASNWPIWFGVAYRIAPGNSCRNQLAILESSCGTSCPEHASHLPRKGCRLLIEREMCRLFKPYDVLRRRIDLREVLFRERKWIGIVIAA